MIGLIHGRALRGAPAPDARSSLAADFPTTTTVAASGDIIDLVAVGRRLDGDRIPLRGAETRFAAVYGTKRLGMSAAELAALLGVDKRMIVRYRTAGGPQ